MKKIIYTLILFVIFIPHTFAKEQNTVNIYFFHSNTCIHCNQELKLLKEISDDYNNVKVYKYEINEEDSKNLFNNVKNILNIKTNSVPLTIIGNKYFLGYSNENSKKTFISTIEYFSKYKYTDKIGEYINNNIDIKEKITMPNKGITPDITLEEYNKNYSNYTYKVPIINTINVSNLPLTITSVLTGIIDCFISQLFIICIIIIRLIKIENPKEKFIKGISLILTTGIVHFLLMTIIDTSKILSSIPYIKKVIAILYLIIGIYNLLKLSSKTNYLKYQNLSINHKRNVYIIIMIILIITTNIIELPLSFEIKETYQKIIYLSNLTLLEEISYLITYIISFLMTIIIIFITVINILNKIAKSKKYKLTTKIFSGVTLIIIGTVLLF